MSIYDQEIFGPVLLVVRCDTYPEALELVNANPHGNGAAVFTNDGGAARLFEQQVTAGMVGINVPDPGADGLPLLRRLEGVAVRRPARTWPPRVRFYTRDKVVTRRWPDPEARRGVDLGFPTRRLSKTSCVAPPQRGVVVRVESVWPETSRGVRR